MGTVLEQSCVSGVLAPELFLRLLDYLSPETLDPQGVTIQKESELLIAVAWCSHRCIPRRKGDACRVALVFDILQKIPSII